MSVSDLPKLIPLWPEGAPATPYKEVEEFAPDPLNFRQLRNVTQPALMPFLPDPAIATGTAVIICPGGAFHALAIDHEGIEVARWFQARGIASFVLKYRLHQSPASSEEYEEYIQELLANRSKISEVTKEVAALATLDGLQAMQLVRRNAPAWNIDPYRIGIMGFSAGARVTVGVVLEGKRDSRPDFAAPIYGALWEEITVPDPAPPLFIAVANNDELSVDSCLALYSSWHAAGKSVELHIYASGGHGFGMKKQGLPIDGWLQQLDEWLHSEGFDKA